ncbi:hypothetical protein C8R44DRAFT_754642 [Mycena epipterygia]|nr:hypothetical protein C8R44DRAFT_754642 [Mycena epipterygia]
MARTRSYPRVRAIKIVRSRSRELYMFNSPGTGKKEKLDLTSPTGGDAGGLTILVSPLCFYAGASMILPMLAPSTALETCTFSGRISGRFKVRAVVKICVISSTPPPSSSRLNSSATANKEPVLDPGSMASRYASGLAVSWDIVKEKTPNSFSPEMGVSDGGVIIRRFPPAPRFPISTDLPTWPTTLELWFLQISANWGRQIIVEEALAPRFVFGIDFLGYVLRFIPPVAHNLSSFPCKPQLLARAASYFGPFYPLYPPARRRLRRDLRSWQPPHAARHPRPQAPAVPSDSNCL